MQRYASRRGAVWPLSITKRINPSTGSCDDVRRVYKRAQSYGGALTLGPNGGPIKRIARITALIIANGMATIVSLHWLTRAFVRRLTGRRRSVVPPANKIIISIALFPLEVGMMTYL